MTNFVRIWRSPLIVNQFSPLKKDLPDDISLQDAIAEGMAYAKEHGYNAPYHIVWGDGYYRFLQDGVFEMHPNNTPKCKIDNPFFPVSERQRRKKERKKENG